MNIVTKLSKTHSILFFITSNEYRVPFPQYRYKSHRIQAGHSYISTADNGIGVSQLEMFHKRDNLKNCFCMMTLEKNLTLAPQIQVTPFIAENQPFPKYPRWLVAGWGRTEKETNPLTLEGKSSIKYWSRDLRAALAFRVDECQKYYPEATADSNLFCLGLSDHEKTTFGDQGGPVYSIEEEVVYGMIINGVTDTRDVENNQSMPMLMTKVQQIKSWIDKRRGVTVV